MKRSFQINPLSRLCAAFDDFKIARERFSFLVVELAGLFIGDPSMDTTTAGIDPEDVVEAEVFPQGGIDDFDGHCGEGPAFGADVCFGAAGSGVVVVCQIYIENNLLRQWAKCAALS